MWSNAHGKVGGRKFSFRFLGLIHSHFQAWFFTPSSIREHDSMPQWSTLIQLVATNICAWFYIKNVYIPTYRHTYVHLYVWIDAELIVLGTDFWKEKKTQWSLFWLRQYRFVTLRKIYLDLMSSSDERSTFDMRATSDNNGRRRSYVSPSIHSRQR